EITPAAAARIAQQGEGKSRLRLGVYEGGCQGYKYGLGFDAEINDDDFVFGSGDGQLVINEFALEMLDGCAVDFVESPMGSGFKILNPTSGGGCGCGSSFKKN